MKLRALSLSALLVSASACDILDNLGGKGDGRQGNDATATPGGAAQGAPGTALPASTKPLPLAVGQWARWSTKRGNAAAGELTYKIVGKEGEAYWMEVASSEGGQKVVLQLLFRLGDDRTPDSSSIEKAKMRLPTGQTHVLSGATLKGAMAGLNEHLRHLATNDFSGWKQEDVTVPAGTFKGAFTRENKLVFAGIADHNRTWNHPSVPITTLVKLQSLKDDTTMELVAFGLTGAKTEMP